MRFRKGSGSARDFHRFSNERARSYIPTTCIHHTDTTIIRKPTSCTRDDHARWIRKTGAALNRSRRRPFLGTRDSGNRERFFYYCYFFFFLFRPPSTSRTYAFSGWRFCFFAANENTWINHAAHADNNNLATSTYRPRARLPDRQTAVSRRPNNHADDECSLLYSRGGQPVNHNTSSIATTFRLL